MKRLMLAVLFVLLSGVSAQAAEEAGGINPVEHVVDGQEWELPGFTVHLPTLHLGGFALPITKHVVMEWIACLLIIAVVLVARSGKGLVPSGLYNALESIVVFVRDELAVKNIGEHHGPAYVPYLLTVFCFILAANFLGMIPFMATATSNINVTFTLASMTLLLMVGTGIKAHGVVGYWTSLVPHGVPLWLWPVMFVVELLGLIAKPFALMLRLFANMLAGHMVILSLLGLIFTFTAVFGPVGGYGVLPVSLGFSLFVSLLEVLVALIQAYIFTFLTSLFIGMAVHSH